MTVSRSSSPDIEETTKEQNKEVAAKTLAKPKSDQFNSVASIRTQDITQSICKYLVNLCLVPSTNFVTQHIYYDGHWRGDSRGHMALICATQDIFDNVK